MMHCSSYANMANKAATDVQSPLIWPRLDIVAFFLAYAADKLRSKKR